MLYLIHTILVVILLFIYLIITLARQYIYKTKIIIAIPESQFYQVLLAEFYELYLPVSILISSYFLCKSVLIILLFQLILFPDRIHILCRDSIDIYRRVRLKFLH